MLTINISNDTPVRHEKYSITKTCLLYDRPQPKVNGICVQEKLDEPSTLRSFSSSNKPALQEDISMDEGCDSKTDIDVSMATFDVVDTSASTSYKPFVSHECDKEEEVMISGKEVFTPDYINTQSKAVSSTPNQDTSNLSKLKRNVASQTNLTLNTKDINEYDEAIKSYITESTEGRRVDITTHLRPVCKTKVMNLHTPVDHKMTNVRKMSLRSKTMITSAFERSKDMLPRYKSMEEKRLISNTYSLLPHPKTPPSNSDKVIHNPFEVDLSERLGKSIFSPDVFENVLSPSEDSESMRWTIEDISSINPVPIEEDFTLPSDDEDPEKESLVQQEIERYFSETHSVLSPGEFSKPGNLSQVNNAKKHTRAAASTPQKTSVIKIKEFANAITQTSLSLPINLPSEVEVSLGSFFKQFEVDDFNISASNLRRKLFFHSEDDPPSPVRFEIHSSPITKESIDYDFSPYDSNRGGRHFTPLSNQGAISSPEMSPVIAESTSVKLLSSCKKTLHHLFSGENDRDDSVEDSSENSQVILNSAVDLKEMVLDSESNSGAPSSQDTGYHTEESWQHCKPFTMMASTPTRCNQ